jgi:hypothetical protein
MSSTRSIEGSVTKRNNCTKLLPSVRTFEAHARLRNPHLMTVLAEYWPRNRSTLPQSTERLFEVETGTRLLTKHH